MRYEVVIRATNNDFTRRLNVNLGASCEEEVYSIIDGWNENSDTTNHEIVSITVVNRGDVQ